jgi:hypothetical protein
VIGWTREPSGSSPENDGGSALEPSSAIAPGTALGVASAKVSTGRASANAEAIAVPFKKCLRDAFERGSKVVFFMSARRFIRSHRPLSSQRNDSSCLAGGLLALIRGKTKARELSCSLAFATTSFFLGLPAKSRSQLQRPAPAI